MVSTTGKAVSASFSYDSYGPEKAIDGDTNTGWPNVFHTKLGVALGWWSVDLGVEVSSPGVTIYFRSDCKYKLIFVHLKHSKYSYSSYT